ncbi:MAG: hypothetical protein AB1485_06320 [Candidatus Thermoplasmatota archaeon]
MKAFPGKYCLVILGLVIAQVFSSTTVGSASPEEIEIRIPSENPRFAFNSPVLVAGIWHFLNFSLDRAYTNVSLLAYRGDSRPAPNTPYNYTNYYLWWYEGTWNSWNESYIDTNKCAKTANTYSFYLGVDGRAESGNWSLEILGDGVQIAKKNVFTEAPRTGFGISSSIYLRVEPFTAKTVSSTPDYLRIINQGNVPLALKLSYDKYTERIATSNLPPEGIVLHVIGESYHYISFDCDAWSPRIIRITGTVSSTPLYTIPIPASVALVPSYEQTFPAIVHIGHSGWGLQEPIQGFTFQHREAISVSWNEIEALVVYFCGNANISFKVETENITLLNVTYNNIEQKQPFVIYSTEAKEEVAIINLKAEIPSISAYVRYILTVEGNTYSYSTRIDVGAKPEMPITPPEGLPATGIWIVVAIILIVVVVIVLRHLKAGR